MSKYIKPDVSKVWADSGSKTKPLDSKISAGWVVEKPKFENMNWLQNRQDSYLRYINQLGIPEWDDKTQYIAGQSYVQGTTTGNVYRCVTTHGGTGSTPKNPEADSTNSYWQLAFDIAGSAATVASALSTLSANYENLSGVNPNTARSSLSVYSIAEVDTAIGKAAKGLCRLSLVGSDLTLLPFKGNQISINSVDRTIPAAGVVVSSAGASANTLYYIYAYWQGGAVVLEKSTTGYTPDTTTGVSVKTGDNTRVLVGMARTNGSSAWELVRSYFNDTGIVSSGFLSTERTVTSTTYTEVNSEIRCGFLCWSDEVVSIEANGTLRIDSSSKDSYTAIAIDGTVQDAFTLSDSFGTNANVPAQVSFQTKSLTEGYHYATLMGKASGLTWNLHYAGGSTAGERTTLRVSISGR